MASRNISLPVIDRFARWGLIDDAAETAAVAGILGAVEVQPRALYTRAGAFSGGNQQKIAIGKWLLAGSRILLMFDPTRGVDIGTKHQLYLLMRRFADAGGAILFHSTEIAELVNLCDRVQVLYAGRVALELEGDAIEEEAIMRAALGETRARAGHGGVSVAALALPAAARGGCRWGAIAGCSSPAPYSWPCLRLLTRSPQDRSAISS